MKLSQLELYHGFQQIWVYDVFGDNQSEWTYVWARVLGDSDIILRLDSDTSVSYAHKRFGVTSNWPNNPPVWHGIGHRWAKDAVCAIMDASFEADEIDSVVKILPRKADIRYGDKP
jgi:hypothetical protein